MKGWILALLAGMSWASALVFAFYPYLLIEGGGIGIFTGAIVASALVHLLGNLDWPKWYPEAWRRRRAVVPVVLLLSLFLMAFCVPWRSSLLGMLDILKVPLALAEGIHWFLLSFSLVALFRFLSFFFRWFQALELAVLVLLVASPIYGPMHHGNGKPHWLFDHLIEAGGDQSSKLPFWVISAFASLPLLCFFLSFDGRGKPTDEKSKGGGLPVLSGIIFVLGFCLAVAASFQARSLIEQDNRPVSSQPSPNPFEPPPPPKPPPLALVDLPDSMIPEPEGYYFRVGILEDSNQSVASLKFKPLALAREEDGSTELNSSSDEQLLTKVYPYEKEAPQLLLKDARRMSDIRPIPKGGFSDAYMVDSKKINFSFRQAYGKYVGKTGRVFETEKEKLVSSLRKADRYNAVIIGRDQNSSGSSWGNKNAITFFREFSENKSLQKIKGFAAEKLRLRLSPAVEFYFVINSLENTFALSDEQGKEHMDSPIQGFMKGDYNGSSSHFALAAYYWLQARNIPCRLVTGYFLPKKGDKVEEAAYVFPAHQRIWLEGLMGKKGMFTSNPQWTPIFISPKVIIDQNQPEEPDDPPPLPEKEKENEIEQEAESSASGNSVPPNGYLQAVLLIIAFMLFLLLVVRPLFRFYPWFLAHVDRSSAMLIALRWLDLYGERRKYGESILEFVDRLKKDRKKLPAFDEIAKQHRKEFTPCDDASFDWAERLKALRQNLKMEPKLKITANLRSKDTLWKVFGFPAFEKIQNATISESVNKTKTKPGDKSCHQTKP